MCRPSTGRRETRSRLFATWRRTISISWPVSVQQVFETLMRTTDVLVAGSFSPAAVAAVGLADLYAQLPLRLGQGLGGGAIALSSQDTGSGATANRDEAVTQALLMGLLASVPFVVFGLLFARDAIALLGAPPNVARLGGTYLAVLFVASPARHVALIGVYALQGTGDTRTPMLIIIAANVLNIVGSVGLGLGIGPAPRLSILGVGLSTAAANVFTAVSILLVIWGPWGELSFVPPTDRTITRQLVAVSVPRFGEGLSATVAAFPFNAILLGFGTEVVAAYHIGRRMYQQFTGPFYRALSTAASILVGQTLGSGAPAAARFDGWAVGALGLLTLGITGGGTFLGAEVLVRIFTSDPATIAYAVDFARTFGVGAILLGLYFVFSGALRGAGETRTPFFARLTGTFGFLVGFSYVVGVVLGYGVPAVYAGILLTYAWMLGLVLVGFARGDWADRATAMMAERESA